MIPINPEGIGDPNQTPVVYVGEELGKALGIRQRPSFAERRAAADPSVDHSSHSQQWVGACPECPADSSPPSPAQRPTGQVDHPPMAKAPCDHFFVYRVRGGEPVSVGVCSFCGNIDWPDLRQSFDEKNAVLLADLDAAREALRRVERERAAIIAAGELMLAEVREQRDELRQHILDIDAHATPFGDLPEDPGYVGTYLLTAGALHRALGKIGHTAPKCQAEAERDRMRPVVEAARELRASQRRDILPPDATRRDLLALVQAHGPVRAAFAAAVDTYETQEGTDVHL